MRNAKRVLISCLMFSCLIFLYSFDLPKNWYRAGSDPKSYDMGLDKGSAEDGSNAATIKANTSKVKGFGTLMQDCLPDKYLGKRVRMTGYMKSKEVSDKAGFWLRVDQGDSKTPLTFDNMMDRAVTGTSDWKKYEIVLDVPLNASNMAFGALLVGSGQIWFDKLNFEIVDATVLTTGKGKDALMPSKEPLNLDFER